MSQKAKQGRATNNCRTSLFIAKFII